MLEGLIFIVLPKSNIAIVGFCSCDLFALRFNLILELSINLLLDEDCELDRFSLIGVFGDGPILKLNASRPQILLSVLVTL